MKILEVKSIVFPEIKIIRYGRFVDVRGFFSEIYRRTDFQNKKQLRFLKNAKIAQANISYSKKGVIRGLHFQWNPPMGKLVRTIQGKMIDLFVDIRKGFPNFGKLGAYEMVAHVEDEHNQWLWIPPGFAHGCFFLKDSLIEYFCTAEYNPKTESAISPLAVDIDWSVCDKKFKDLFDNLIQKGPIISEKDRKGYTLSAWKNQPAANNFIIKRNQLTCKKY